MKNINLFLWSITAALAGFLFGFDTIVISGAEQKIQEAWGLSSFMHGLCLSAALWGTVLGAIFGGIPTERLGRKPTLIWIGSLYFVSAILSAIAPEPYTFMIARFIGGVGVGISTVVAPMYIAEISPANMRGRLTGMFQFNIVFGILIAFASNYIIGVIFDDNYAWRIMLGVEAIPALVYSLLSLRMPESPRWLISHARKHNEGETIFRRINPEFSDEAINRLVSAIERESDAEQNSAAKHSFFSRQVSFPIMIAFFVAFFNQLSGINAILYFAPRIFEWTGLAKDAALLQSVGIGIINLIFTYIGIWLIDKVGRRTLLYIGCGGYVLSLGLCAIAFYTKHYDVVPPLIFLFIAAHAVGQGTVIWVLISEVFPNKFRAAGQSLGSFTHWFFAALLTLIFPAMAENIQPAFIFGFFCFMMILEYFWIRFMVPETKNVALEDMKKALHC